MTQAADRQSIVEPSHSIASKLPDGSSSLAERIGEYAADAFRREGVADYCLGLSIRGERTYYTAGRMCDQQEAAVSPPVGFEIGCLFKPLIAAVALELSAGGKLDLRAPIGCLLPELAADSKGQLIQVRHLISHTAGYMGFTLMPPVQSFPSRDTGLARIRNSLQIFWPGSVFSYEHSGTAILGEILQRISGRTALDLVTEMIFQPLGLSVRAVPERSVESPDQSGSDATTRIRAHSLLGSALSVVDMLSIVEAFMGGDRGANPACLTTATLEALRGQVVAIPRTPGTSAEALLPVGCGLGLTVYRHGFFGYDGKTWRQAAGFRFDPARRIAIALGLDRGAPGLRRVVMAGMLDIISGRDGGAGYPEGSEVEEDSMPYMPHLREIAGDYVGDHASTVFVRVRSGDVMLAGRTRMGHGFAIRGSRDQRGYPVFQVGHPGGEPTFFRYPRTGEPCLMLGMCALKKVPLWIAR